MKIPSSTYRLQFNHEFRFRDGEKLLPYLSQLGISDIYSSPVFKAVHGSMHGYDITDHNTLNPETGTTGEFHELHVRRKELGMGWIQDIVPNHMAFDGENMILRDVLEHGRYSQYSDFFDIEWNHTHESLKGRLLAPFLGGFYSEALEKGEIKILYEEEGLFAGYYKHKFPMSLISYPLVFTGEGFPQGEMTESEKLAVIKLQGVLHQFRILAESSEVPYSFDGTSHAKKVLWNLYSTEMKIREFMGSRLIMYNNCMKDSDPGLLDSILEKQMYRLSFWKVADEEINYRRFFNINGLISLRIENDAAFNHSHALMKRLIEDGDITGIRVDHVDGLYNPARYLEKLSEIAGDSYIVIEKIITGEEAISGDWPIHGTTGYDFMNRLNGIYCKTENEKDLSRFYSGFIGKEIQYDELAAEKKRLIIEKNMTGDVDNLAAMLKQISGNDRYGRDITMHGLRNALVEIIAFFPVYRTYINTEKISDEDSGYLKIAFEKARRYAPEFSFEYDFLEKCLTLNYVEHMDEEKKAKLLHLIMRFQQYTGPFMAKGFEDTVLYIANRLISLNEVGGNPGKFGTDVARFHDFISTRAGIHKHSMNATSTHDTKRGEDARCRINVISELPGEWKKSVKGWTRHNRRKGRGENESVFPDRNDEYFLYQTLIGTFPSTFENYGIYVQRIKDYMIKSVREARLHTAWIKPDNEYETKLLRFIERMLLPAEGNRFLEPFIPFQRKVVFYGMLNSISQLIVKAASPGVPDFYQGTELWDFRLVDPDNRGPVDFTLRKKYLEYIMKEEQRELPALIKELWDTREDGRIKLFLTRRLLNARLKNSELFNEGDYIPLETWGSYKNSVIAFMRVKDGEAAVAVAPRLMTGFVKEGELPVGEIWQDTGIIMSTRENYIMEDTITGKEMNFSGQLLLKDVLQQFPGAVLTGVVRQKPVS